ncbi:MAG: glycosyltransferase family 4 protein [Cyanobacteria bacterium P01_F01_bin.33]
MLEAFYTDMCAGRGIGRFAALASRLPLPKSFRKLTKNLACRRPPPNVIMHTRTCDVETLCYEALVRFHTNPLSQKRLLAGSAMRRGRRMASWGTGAATHVFNVIGEGGKLILEAKDRGLPVLSDIIVALSTHAIEKREHRAFPDWGPAPDADGFKDIYFEHAQHLLETTDTFVCPSTFVAEDLTMNWGVDSRKVRIVPYVVSSDWFKIQPRTEIGRVLFAGSANRRKGIHYLAVAANELCRRGYRYDFRVAGDVAPAVKTHPHARSLVFFGRVPRSEVALEFACADIFVLPTLAEGSATVIYEAMAARLPVITTRSAGSMIEDGVDGIIVPERDPYALSCAIERLVEDRRMREEIAAKAREKAISYGWSDYARLIRKLVAEPDPMQ